MALSLRLRRAITTLSSSSSHLTRSSFSLPPPLPVKPTLPPMSPFLLPQSATEQSKRGGMSARVSTRMFSTKQYKLYKEGDEITPDTVLFEGCDYNHWLITMDFPKDNPPSREEMIATYEQTCAKGLGISLEEAKKRMYACSTTTYQGFQAIMTEEESEKFRDIPGVVFILPDSYIDPVNKEYGGDKYENGVITPRPPPVQYGRSRPRDRNRDQPRYDRQGSPSQNYQGNPQYRQQGSVPGDVLYGPQQNYPPQQNYGPPGHGGQGSPMQYQGNYNQGGQGSQMPPYQGSYNQGGPGGYSQGPPGNYNQGPQGNYNRGPPRNYNQGQQGNSYAGINRNYAPTQGGNYGQMGNPGYGQGSPGHGQNQGFPLGDPGADQGRF